MKKNIIYALFLIIGGVFTSCKKQNTPEALQIQKAYTYDDQYFRNLRAYKASPHQVFYGWFAAYANKEGVVADYKQSPSWGEHFAGLPDSIDFCSMWMGTPSMNQKDSLTTYNPIAYNEMQKSREVRGIKMLVPVIVSIENHDFDRSDEGLRTYAKYLTDLVFDNNIDGLDLDWEPGFDDYLADPENFAKLIEYCSERVGPKSGTGKYLVVDYYTHSLPTTIEPYIDYVVNQAYTPQGVISTSASFLQSRYDDVRSWCPPGKFIVTENLGEWWENGGAPFTEVDGNTLTTDGQTMTSLEGMARWNPIQGQKAGWGGFYFERDYNTGNTPFSYVRRSIQIVNPAIR